MERGDDAAEEPRRPSSSGSSSSSLAGPSGAAQHCSGGSIVESRCVLDQHHDQCALQPFAPLELMPSDAMPPRIQLLVSQRRRARRLISRGQILLSRQWLFTLPRPVCFLLWFLRVPASALSAARRLASSRPLGFASPAACNPLASLLQNAMTDRDPYPSAPPSYLQPGSTYQPMGAPSYAQPPSGYGQPTYAAQPSQLGGLGVDAGYHPQQGYSAAGAQQGPAGYSQVHVPLYQANVGPCAAGGGHQISEEFSACGLVCGILLFRQATCRASTDGRFQTESNAHAVLLRCCLCCCVLFVLVVAIGLICCLALKDRTCLRCGMRFD